MLADTPSPRGGTWNKQEVILYVPASGESVYKIPASGGTPTPVTKLDSAKRESRHNWPSFLPDGKHFFYSVVSSDEKIRGIYLGSIDGEPVRRLVPVASRSGYARGFLLYVKDRGLFAQAFDASALQIKGEPVRIADGVGWDEYHVDSHSFSSSENGAVAYWTGITLPRVQATWFDRHGKVLSAVGQPDFDIDVAISPEARVFEISPHSGP